MCSVTRILGFYYLFSYVIYSLILLVLTSFEGLELYWIFYTGFLWFKLLKFSSVLSDFKCLRLSLPFEVECTNFFSYLTFLKIWSVFYYFLGFEEGIRAVEVLRWSSEWGYLAEMILADFLREMGFELIMGWIGNLNGSVRLLFINFKRWLNNLIFIID